MASMWSNAAGIKCCEAVCRSRQLWLRMSETAGGDRPRSGALGDPRHGTKADPDGEERSYKENRDLKRASFRTECAT